MNAHNLIEGCGVGGLGTCPTAMITTDPVFETKSTCSNGQTYLPISICLTGLGFASSFFGISMLKTPSL